MVSIGLIEVKVATPEPVVEEIPEPEVINEKPIHIVLDGYDYAYQEGNFALDVEVFEEEKFFATYASAEIPVENVNLDISLYNEENQLIHSFSGVVKDGKYRYDVVAKETSQKMGLWHINNLYTVEVIATSGDNTAKKSYEFLGRESSAYDKGEAATTTSWEEQVTNTVEINDSTENGPSLEDGDWFGKDITNIGDLNGDGVNDLAVGADGDDDPGSNRGAIHIMFMNTDGTVDETVEINSSTTNGPALEEDDEFGSSIADIGDLNGDGVNDIAVGAEKDEMDENGNSSGGIDRGAIHIMLMNTDGSIDSIVEFNDFTTNGPTLSNRDQFGTSIVNIGDLDGNGINDLAVGAYLDDMDENGNSSGHNASGAIHILFLE